VSGTRILAEMQTPSQAVPLELHAAEDVVDEDGPGSALQRIIRFDLKEEGNHVLAVNVTYTETAGEGQATGGKVRSFRKLYQFLAQPCLSVRTKATELEGREISDKMQPYGRTTVLRYVLEAQLENVSDASIVLEETKLQSRQPFRSTSLNCDANDKGDSRVEHPFLKPRDVIQVAFLVEQEDGVTDGMEELQNSLRGDGRAVLGQLAIQWRTSMGERGSLSTGNLMTRRRAA
jgi:trafficking protein particle complex subunit 13